MIDCIKDLYKEWVEQGVCTQEEADEELAEMFEKLKAITPAQERKFKELGKEYMEQMQTRANLLARQHSCGFKVDFGAEIRKKNAELMNYIKAEMPEIFDSDAPAVEESDDAELRKAAEKIDNYMQVGTEQVMAFLKALSDYEKPTEIITKGYNSHFPKGRIKDTTEKLLKASGFVDDYFPFCNKKIQRGSLTKALSGDRYARNRK